MTEILLGLVWAWLGLAALVWLGLLAGVGRWGRAWILDRGTSSSRVRVCVPARDEAGPIGACVSAVLASDHSELELVVVDDGSTDGTAAEALVAGAGDPRLEVRPAPPRPAGWAGKPWAITAAARGADTPWLLFVDADVRLDPSAISALLSRAEADEVDLISVFGSWELASFWEELLVPAVGWLIRGAVDLDRINTASGAEGPAFANGQLIGVRRERWLAWGGHEPVAAEVLEDVKLARVAREHGARLLLLHAPWAFRVRLYTGLGQIIAGYRKNLYEGMGRHPGVAVVAALAVLLTTSLPLVIAPILLALGWMWTGLAALVIAALVVIFRWRLERADGRSGWVAPLHPLAGLILVWIIATSATHRRVRWKGRTFVAGATDQRSRPPNGRRLGDDGAGDETRTRDD